MPGYTAREIGVMLALSPSQVRAFARTGFLTPERGTRGEYRFSFQDLVLLRTAKELSEAKIPPRKIKRALKKLKDQLPTGRPLTAVRIVAEGDRIVVQDGGTLWNPDSGQVAFDFAVADLATKTAPFAKRAAEAAREEEEQLGSDDWFKLGCELEIGSPNDARDAYRRAIELDPHHVDAHVNLGRLLHESLETSAAEAHYRIAIATDPAHPTAAFNLGVALEDMGRIDDAIAAYQEAIEADPRNADAHFNIAGLYEAEGRKTSAFRHLKTYRQLTRG